MVKIILLVKLLFPSLSKKRFTCTYRWRVCFTHKFYTILNWLWFYMIGEMMQIMERGENKAIGMDWGEKRNEGEGQKNQISISKEGRDGTPTPQPRRHGVCR